MRIMSHKRFAPVDVKYTFFFYREVKKKKKWAASLLVARWDVSVLRPLGTDGARPPTPRHNYCITQQLFSSAFRPPPLPPPPPLHLLPTVTR